jgi:hypothetical protein
LWRSWCFFGLTANNAAVFLVRTSWFEIVSLVRAALGDAAGLVYAVALAWDTK